MEPADILESINSGQSIVIAAKCTITYSGRAESFLAEGDRLIIVKSDKTLLIHQPTGSTPINYMKDNTAFKVYSKEGKIVIRCDNGKEFMLITISKIYSSNAHELSDGQKLQLVGSEKDMSVMIFNNPHLIEKGFTPLSMEEHTKFGFIDVFGFDKSNTLVIVECKRYVADPKAIEQLKRYVDKVKETKGISKIRGIIAAPKISPSAEAMCRQFGFEFRAISPPKYHERFDSAQKKLDF